jgi:hypothetical protein
VRLPPIGPLELTFRQWLDRAAMDHPFRRTAIHLLVGLAEQSGRFPPDLLVYYNEDLVIRMDIFKSSGYGDTYRGTYMTRDVIVKVMKPGQDSQAVYENKRVSLISLALTFARTQIILAATTGGHYLVAASAPPSRGAHGYSQRSPYLEWRRGGSDAVCVRVDPYGLGCQQCVQR